MKHIHPREMSDGAMPGLAMLFAGGVITVGIITLVFFWVPLFLYAWHWWSP